MRFLRTVLLIPLLTPACAESAHWWEREPLRILNLVNALSLTISSPQGELAAKKAAQGYNVEHFEATDMRGGLDDERLYFKTAAASKTQPDYLGRYLPEARKRGLRVIVYFNTHWYSTAFAAKHPDWVQIEEDGKPLSGVYNVGTNFCVNSPYREWILQIVRDLSAYPIDGIFFDGPIFSPSTCYCRFCREKFRRAYGGEMPSKRIRRGKPFHDLVDFQASSLRDFLHDSRRAIKAANPGIAFYMNGGGRGANWGSARLNRVLVSEQDMLGFEGGVLSADLSRTPLWKPSVTAKLLETQAPDKPRVVFCASKESPWPFTVMPEPETRLLYAETIANAANVWMGAMPPDLDTPEMRAVAEMNRFVARNGEYYLGTRSEAAAAIVWSDTTANFYGRDNDAEFTGLTDALESARTPFDVIDDVSLENENLDRYRLILLPNVACMSARAAERITGYVERGGSVLATYETSLYDENGDRRREYALARLFGASGAEEVPGTRRWDLMRPAAASWLLEGIARELIPTPPHYVRVAAAGAAAPLLDMQPLAGPYEGMPAPGRDPAALVHSFGKGEAVFFTGDLGGAIAAYHMPEHLRMVENAVRRLAPPPVALENGPRSIEVTLRSQRDGRRLLLHLVNCTGEMVRPIRATLPVENLRIAVRASGVKAVRTLADSRALPFASAPGGFVRFVLPRLDTYQVILLER